MDLLSLSLEEIEKVVQELGEQKFRAKQLYSGYLNKLSFQEITTLSPGFKQKLEEKFDAPPKIIETFTSKIDGTQKFLFEFFDGNIVEGVLMKYEYGSTICVSTQVGCRMGCKFCASTVDGLVRNLSAGEILGQVLAVNKMLGGTVSNRLITNVVLMGSGEPLDNFENVVKFLKLVSSENGLNISRRNISLSTCGIVPKIKELADMNLGVTLSISLHSVEDDTRKMLMPIAKTYSVEELIEAAKYYYKKTGRRVIFEYSVVDGVNHSAELAKKIANTLKGFPCHLNLILLNPVKEAGLKAPTKKQAYVFMGELEKLGVSVSLRRQMGVDIDGACGQLRNKFVRQNTVDSGN